MNLGEAAEKGQLVLKNKNYLEVSEKMLALIKQECLISKNRRVYKGENKRLKDELQHLRGLLYVVVQTNVSFRGFQPRDQTF